MYPWDIQYGKKKLLSGTTSAILDSMDEALKKPGVGPLKNKLMESSICKHFEVPIPFP